MFKSIELRIYPDEFQVDFFNRQFGCCRYVYNTFLNQKQSEYSSSGKYLSLNECSRLLTEEKKINSWLKDADSTALINTLRNLENAYNRFFKGKSKFPKFKSKNNPVQSYRTNMVNNNIRFEDNGLRLPKVGVVRFRTHQKLLLGDIKNVTIKRTSSDKYFAIVLCEYTVSVSYRENGRSCGLDWGLKNFITINTGEIIHFPQQKEIKRLNKKIKRLQKRLSKKKKGSNNYNKLKQSIAECYEKIHNILHYHFYKIVQRLTQKYQIICIETLNIQGMLKNTHLSRSIQEKAWHMFTKILEEKAQEHKRQIIKIDPWYPSSKTCNNCGYHNKELKLSDRNWTCPECKTTLDRDVNAAKNIHQQGMKTKIQ